MGRDNQEFDGALGLTPVMYAVLYDDMDMLNTVRTATLSFLVFVFAKYSGSENEASHVINGIECVMRRCCQPMVA